MRTGSGVETEPYFTRDDEPAQEAPFIPSEAETSEVLNRFIRELESEREHLRQQIAEQKGAINDQAGEISDLDSRVAELSMTLEQHEVDSLRAAGVFAISSSHASICCLPDNAVPARSIPSACMTREVHPLQGRNRRHEQVSPSQAHQP